MKNVFALTGAALLSASFLSVFGEVPSTTEIFSYKRGGETKALSELVQGGKIVRSDGTFVYEGPFAGNLPAGCVSGDEAVERLNGHCRPLSERHGR